MALLADGILGEPPRFAHPVVGVGKIAEKLISLSPTQGRARPFACGMGITILGAIAFVLPALLISLKVPLFLPFWCGSQAGISPSDLPLLLLGAFLLKTTFAGRELLRAMRRVEEALERGEIERARERLRDLVGRPREKLPPPKIRSAVVESGAENLADGFVAPLFWFLILGLPGAALYRAVNTMDAMMGYRGRFEFLGKFAARFDDILSFIPSRLAAFLLLLLRPRRALRGLMTALRDRKAVPSPNARWPIAMISGILQVRLEKEGVYILGRDFPSPGEREVREAEKLVLGGILLWSCGIVLWEIML